MPVFQYTLIGCLLMPTLFVTAWDIAVLTKDEIDFFYKGQFMGNIGGRLKELQSATYDPVAGYLYVSDVNQKDNSIFRTNLFRTHQEPTIVPFQAVVSKQERVYGITFDPVTDTLFWTTGQNHTIMKLTMNHSEAITFPQPGIMVHQFNQEKPHAIAVDSCRGVLYWTNIHHPEVTIEKSKFDGTDREVIIKDNLQQPYGIEVDIHQKKIYWCDTKDLGFVYLIERANLDGSKREVVTRGVHGNPMAITITQDYLYWADLDQKKLLGLPKNTVGGGVEPSVIQKYPKEVNDLVSSSLFLDIDTKDCPAMIPFTEKISKSSLKELNVLQNSLAESIDTNMVDPLSRHCLNNGTLVKSVCICDRGFRGTRCELPVCLNYCVGKAKCELDAKTAQPTCRCARGWEGPRCERDRCQGICLNGGRCSLDKSDRIICQCPDGYHGPQCQYVSAVIDELCQPLCVELRTTQATKTSKSAHQESTFSMAELEKMAPQMCRCAEMVTTAPNVDAEAVTASKPTEISSRLNVVLISSLVVLCAMLGIVVVFLTVRMVSQRKRPRIRKRIVVNKPISPFPCIPDQPSREQCEITIENCCNMNICETPCFEPEFKSSKATFKKKKSEDKRTLIHAMHSNSSQEDETY